MLAYVFQLHDDKVDLLVPNHDWVHLIVRDDTTEAGRFFVKVAGQTFISNDSAAGTDDSAALAADFLAQINATLGPFTAFPGPTGAELRIRHNVFGGGLGCVAGTLEGPGSIRVLPGKPDTYDLQFASNWDLPFTTKVVASRTRGLVSSSLSQNRATLDALSINANQFRNQTRCVFKLEDYGYSSQAVNFLQIIPQFAGVSVDVPLSTTILLTSKQLLEAHTMLSLVGDVPVAATQLEALVLNLPRQISSFEIANLDTVNDLFVSFGVGSQELTVAPGATVRNNRINVSTIALRCSTGPVSVNVSVTLNAQRTL